MRLKRALTSAIWKWPLPQRKRCSSRRKAFDHGRLLDQVLQVHCWPPWNKKARGVAGKGTAEESHAGVNLGVKKMAGFHRPKARFPRPTHKRASRDTGCGRTALLDDGAFALIVVLPGTSSLSASLWALVPALPACSSAGDLAQLPRLRLCVGPRLSGVPALL